MRNWILLIVAALLSFTAAPRNAAAKNALAQDSPAQDLPARDSPAPASLAQNVPPPFSQWMDGVRAEALARGIRQEIVDQALGDVTEPLVNSIERDQTQPETVLSLEDYIASRVRPATVRTGRQMLRRNRALLNRVSKTYGVPAPVIVAVWGLESNFGRLKGNQPTVAVLATMAWNPRRADFFRKELFSALDILNRGDIEPSRMRGSWAGAMGQLQFMPSSYLEYAVDFDKDGRRDIWDSRADIFASIANYLKAHGWVTGQRWGREVTVPDGREIVAVRRDGTCQATRNMTVALPFDEWQRLGVRLPGGRSLPKTNSPASFITGSSRSFLVNGNYDALLAYNCAHAYALSVALLADRIAN